MTNRLLLKNIKTLIQIRENISKALRGKEMAELPYLSNAWLACEDGMIADYGTMEEFPGIADWKNLEIVDCTDKIVMPGYCDSHTHIVYAGNREAEFADRIRGLSYEEIALKGGGIINSAALLQKTNEDELFNQSKERLFEIIQHGTGAVEIKSGYGLNLESELKMLRVIKRLKDLNLIPVKATFLGAHAVPLDYKNNKEGYVKHVIKEMIPAVASEKLADYIDVFCERNYFTADETKLILEAGAKYGLKGKIHAEQLSHTNGIKTGVACKAVSVDHLEYCSDEDIDLLKNSNTIATILPGAAFFLNLPLPPARKMIDAGLPLAFASDYNPGSSPSGNMNFVMSMACVQYKLTPEEALNAGTINGAFAMELQNEVGSISPGKRANFFITKPVNSYTFIPYSFANHLIESVYLNACKINFSN